MTGKKTEETTQSSFTIDQESDVPSVTKLLNRKPLSRVKSTGNNPATKTPKAAPKPTPTSPEPVIAPAPTLQIEPPPAGETSSSDHPLEIHSPGEVSLSPITFGSISLESPLAESAPPAPTPLATTPLSLESPLSEPIVIETQSVNPPPLIFSNSAGIENSPSNSTIENFSSPSSTPPQIQRSRRKAEQLPDLIAWPIDQLQAGKDPLGRGIYQAIQKGATSVLFLRISPSPGPVPIFIATAVVQGQDKLAIWSGLKWNPAIVPEMWNYFVQSGRVELSPPGTNTNQNSHRNVVRSAFGIQKNEFLLLVRAGPPQGCRGVVALISTQSLMTEIDGAIQLIATPPST